MKVIDDFLTDAVSIRAAALRAPYVDWPGHDGEVYKRVCLTEIPGVRDGIEAIYGAVEMLGMGYRLNYGGELPNAAIHSDMGWGTHAMVLYLSEGGGGTAFWRHKKTGATRIDAGQTELLAAIQGDWDDASKWEQAAICRMKFNRALFYESAYFHSRWPFEAFGTDADTGRLIAVAFFTPRG